MVDALGGLLEGGPAEALLRPVVRPRELDAAATFRSRNGRGATVTTNGGCSSVSCRSCRPTRTRHELVATGTSFGAYHAANFCLKHADVFPLADLPQRRLRRQRPGRRRARRRRVLLQSDGLRRAPRRGPSRLVARPGLPSPRVRPGAMGGHDRRARLHAPLRRRCSPRRASTTRSTCGATTCRTTGRRGGPDRPSSPSLCLSDS